MSISVRTSTVISALATLGSVQLLGILYTIVAGWDASPIVGYTWTALFIGALTTSLLGKRVSGRTRGVAFGLTWYTGIQTASYWLTTPTPPSTGHYILGALEGAALLIAALLAKRWFDAGARAAKLSQEANATEKSA